MMVRAVPDTLLRRVFSNRRVQTGGGVLLLIMLACLLTLPWTARDGGAFYYDLQHQNAGQQPPTFSHLWMVMGTTKLGQSLLGRCLLGGVISLAIGVAAAAVSVFLGVIVGVVSGYRGGWVDTVLMRFVDILYGLPYILMVILLKIGLEKPLQDPNELGRGISSALTSLFTFCLLLYLLFPPMDALYRRSKQTLLVLAIASISVAAALRLFMHFFNLPIPTNQQVNLIVLFLAIGLVSWLTMARVIRGQVLSLRSMPFVDAARAVGTPEWRIFLYHLLPNLVGPITVYATLTIPSAILQESTLSFLGIGIQKPLPTWGSLASDGMALALNPINSLWWLLVFPCALLAITLLSLNFLGDGLREVFDPKRRSANV
jgi:oligopeptide transport system permease protein